MEHNYEWGLEKNPANYIPVSPLEFISRTAETYPDKLAIIHGTNIRQTWKETYSILNAFEFSSNA